jgi:hypothetical protein
MVVAVFMAGFGFFWMTGASNAGAPGIFPLFGLLFIVVAIAMPIYYGYKYSAYTQAYEAYQRRRADVLSKLNEIDQ